MNKLLVVLLSLLLLVGCTEKASTAKERGNGISIELETSQNIKHVSLVKYENVINVTSDNVIHADNSPFKEGEIILFDTPLSEDSSNVKIAVAYSVNLDGTKNKTTEKIDISGASKWVNLKLNNDMELEIIDME